MRWQMFVRGGRTSHRTHAAMAEAQQLVAVRLLDADRTSFLTGRSVVVTHWNRKGRDELMAVLRDEGIKRGCYVAYRDGVCQYVGMSTNLPKRLSNHFSKQSSGRENSSFVAEDENLTLIVLESDCPEFTEIDLIVDLVPVCNKETKTVPRRRDGSVRNHPLRRLPDTQITTPLFQFL